MQSGDGGTEVVLNIYSIEYADPLPDDIYGIRLVGVHMHIARIPTVVAADKRSAGHCVIAM
jgi:hypothetical protein